jgi:hypothetical protein
VYKIPETTANGGLKKEGWTYSSSPQADIKLYEGSKIRDLVSGHAEPCAVGMMSSFKFLQKV